MMTSCYEHENERTGSLKVSNVVNSFNDYQNANGYAIFNYTTRYFSIPKRGQAEDGPRMALTD